MLETNHTLLCLANAMLLEFNRFQPWWPEPANITKVVNQVTLTIWARYCERPMLNSGLVVQVVLCGLIP